MGSCPARRSLLGLLVLASVVLGSLTLALVSYNLTQHPTFVSLCRLAWSEVWEHGGTWLILVPLLTLVAAGVSGATSAGQQLIATWRLGRLLTLAGRSSSPRVSDLASHLDMIGRVEVLHADTPFAFCHGFVTPRVYLSTGLVDILDDQELEAVLLHERRHLDCRDPLNVFVSRTLAQTLAFLPIAHQFCKSFLLARELDADLHAVRAQGGPGPLASALLKLSAYHPSLSLDGAAVSRLNVKRERVRQLLREEVPALPGPTRRASVASALIIAMLLITSYSPLLASGGEMRLHADCVAQTHAELHHAGPLHHLPGD